MVGGLGCVGKIAALLQAWVCALALCGLQMCCNVRSVVELLSVSCLLYSPSVGVADNGLGLKAGGH